MVRSVLTRPSNPRIKPAQVHRFTEILVPRAGSDLPTFAAVIITRNVFRTKSKSFFPHYRVICGAVENRRRKLTV